MSVPVGFALPPDEATLDVLAPLLLAEPDYYEVAPETLWMVDADGGWRPNGYHRAFERLRERTGKPFVAHGVGYSVGGLDPRDDARRRTWLERIAATHAAFDFRWYTDHLGATTLDGRALALPLPVPMLDEVADLVRERLAALARVVPDVGVENTAFPYVLGEPLDEPAFLARALDAPGMHLLLDLHNLHANALNLGFDAREWLARSPLERVIEIHLAGGRDSDPAWLDGRVLRLDGHDAAIPEAVWALFEEVAPRCPALRGVTVERQEGTLEEGDVGALAEELRRARSVVA
jgi:uncharacterized protein (UPF0276 family)